MRRNAGAFVRNKLLNQFLPLLVFMGVCVGSLVAETIDWLVISIAALINMNIR